MPESYGLICYAPRVEGTLFAVIEKRHSYSYITFFTTFARNFATLHIRNRMDSDAKIFRLMSTMLKHEKDNILQLTNSLVIIESESAQNQLYERFIAKYGPNQRKELRQKTIDMLLFLCKNGITLATNERYTLRELCENTDSSQPIWEFPKGHRLGNESGHHCAKREFGEETHIRAAKKILYHDPSDDKPKLVERNYGTNGHIYRYIYYTATFVGSYVRPRTFTNAENKEVSQVAWKTRKELYELWATRYPERIKILDTVIEGIFR